MNRRVSFALATITFLGVGCSTPKMGHRPPPDVVTARGGDITISPTTHATVQVSQGSHVILIDPTRYAASDGVGALTLNYDDCRHRHWSSSPTSTQTMKIPSSSIN